MNGFLHAIGPSAFLWPVGVLGIIALAISLERFFFLRIRATVATNDFLAEIQKLVLGGTIDPAIRLCLGHPQAPVANAIRAALLHVDASREDLVLAVEQAGADAVPQVQRRIGYLATIANVATLFGLLGTIVGLIQSFDAVSHAEPAQRQALLAGGIALAMRTTAGGISVAIPCLLAYSYLAQAANAVLDDVDRAGMRLVMLVLSRRKSPPELAPVDEIAGGNLMRRGNRLSTAPPELNLVPLLDMVSLLVQVLLLHVHFGALADLPATPVGAPIGEDDSALALAIDIGDQGFVVRWNDDGQGKSEVLGCTAPCAETAQYPTKDLVSLLGTIKDHHPDDRQAVVRPISDVRFDLIAHTMDLVRMANGRELFPDLALGKGHGNKP